MHVLLGKPAKIIIYFLGVDKVQRPACRLTEWQFKFFNMMISVINSSISFKHLDFAIPPASLSSSCLWILVFLSLLLRNSAPLPLLKHIIWRLKHEGLYQGV